MGFTYRVGIERETGRLALGRRACAQLTEPVDVAPLYASQLRYRAVLFNRLTGTYRLAPITQCRSGEEVVHAGPFIGGVGVWDAPRWLAELSPVA